MALLSRERWENISLAHISIPTSLPPEHRGIILNFFEVDLHRDKRKKNQTHNFNLVHFFLVVSDCHAKFSFCEGEELGKEKNKKKIPTKHKIALSEKPNI